MSRIFSLLVVLACFAAVPGCGSSRPAPDPPEDVQADNEAYTEEMDQQAEEFEEEYGRPPGN